MDHPGQVAWSGSNPAERYFGFKANLEKESFAMITLSLYEPVM